MKNLDSNVTLGWQPKWFMTKEGLVENPDYVEPPPTEPDEDEDVEGDFRSGFAGCWAIPAAFGKTLPRSSFEPTLIILKCQTDTSPWYVLESEVLPPEMNKPGERYIAFEFGEEAMEQIKVKVMNSEHFVKI